MHLFPEQEYPERQRGFTEYNIKPVQNAGTDHVFQISAMPQTDRGPQDQHGQPGVELLAEFLAEALTESLPLLHKEL